MSNYKIVSDKLDRLITFLRGLTNARVGTYMVKAGFTQADLDEGWTLFRRAAGDRLAVRTDGSEPDPKIVAQLDEFENRFFPIVRATLHRRWPAFEAEVFLNLEQTTGPAVAVTVLTLLDRVAKLEGAGADEARAVLAQRGFNAEAIADATGLLTEMGSLAAPLTFDPELDREQREAAEADAWAWYLEWSEIAQANIKNGKLLQRLGYNSGGRPRKVEGEEAAAPTEA